MKRGIETKCIYGDGAKIEGEQTGSISFPIYQTATFAHPAVGQSTGYDYSRLQNPTRQAPSRLESEIERS
ncbi:MAG: PLP-dependent transferase [Clostridiales bacterium]|nr:PLP-dependent transferase [Clostridiales bacterium]